MLVILLLDLLIQSSTLVSHSDARSGQMLTVSVVPYENVVAAQESAASSTGQPPSPPPTFAAATTADGLMDRRNVVTDTAQG